MSSEERSRKQGARLRLLPSREGFFDLFQQAAEKALPGAEELFAPLKAHR